MNSEKNTQNILLKTTPKSFILYIDAAEKNYRYTVHYFLNDFGLVFKN